jgi:hypothetical protein
LRLFLLVHLRVLLQFRRVGAVIREVPLAVQMDLDWHV